MVNTEYIKCQDTHTNNAVLVKIKYNITCCLLTTIDLAYLGSSLSLGTLVTPETLDSFCEFLNLHPQGSVCLLPFVIGSYLGFISCLPSVIT